MNRLDFSFETPSWASALQDLATGSSFSAVRFLALMEVDGQEAMDEALMFLDKKDILLDIRTLPAPAVAGDAALRLKREVQLVKSGRLLQDLEENDPLRLYLEEIALVPVAGDPAILAQQYAQGDENVAPLLVNLMLSYVVENACRLTGKGVLLLDLMQEGALGMWQGILQYTDGDFEEHCRWWIRQYQAKAVTLQAAASGVGQKLRTALEDYRDVDQRLLAELGRNPTGEEIAEQLHISQEETAVLEGMLLNLRKLQLATPQPDQEAQEAEEEARHVEETAYFQTRQHILELLSILEPLDAQILTCRFGLEGGLPLDPQKTGEKLGLTAQQIVERETAALAKLRQQGGNHG